MYGAFDIDSIPPATMTSCSPARIIASAISTARIEDAQTLLIVSDGTSIGSPARLDLEDVESGTGDLALPQRLYQLGLADDPATRHVHEQRARLHEPELARA